MENSANLLEQTFMVACSGTSATFTNLEDAMEYVNSRHDMRNIERTKVGVEVVNLMTNRTHKYAFSDSVRFEALDRLARAVFSRGMNLSDTVYVITDGGDEYAFVLQENDGSLKEAVRCAVLWSGGTFATTVMPAAKPSSTYRLTAEVGRGMREMAEELGFSVEELVNRVCAVYLARNK